MTSYREELGFIERPPKFKPRPPEAKFMGVRELGDEGWEAEVAKADGKRCWFIRRTRDAAIAAARNYVAAKNGETR